MGDVAEPLPDPLPPIDPEQLQQALNELPEVYRTPIILFYFEDFGYREIAEQMDLPIGTVMSRLARAKGHLRSRLLPGGEAVAPHGRGGGRSMDCDSARLCVHLCRPDGRDLDGTETAELEAHLRTAPSAVPWPGRSSVSMPTSAGPCSPSRCRAT